MYRYWRKTGYCQFPYQDVVYLHFISDYGFTRYHLHDPCFLDQYQKLYPCRSQKPVKELVRKKQTNRETE